MKLTLKPSSSSSSVCVSYRLLFPYTTAFRKMSSVPSSSSTATASVLKCCFNGINALSGVGVLALPYAVASGGWLSLICLFVISAITCYTALIMKRCMDVDPSMTTYPDIGERAFGATGRIIVSVLCNLELYMVITGFLILEGDNLHNLFPKFNLHVAGLAIGGKMVFVIIISIVILPTVWFNNLQFLSYVSTTGVLASFVLLGSVIWTATSDHAASSSANHTLVNWRGLPTAVSLYAFCYGAHPIFPTMYTSMQDRRKFSKVLYVCFGLSTASYASMAIVGYIMFGSDVQSQVTLNLPTEKISSKIAIYMILVNPITKYSLMTIPIVRAIQGLITCDCGQRGNVVVGLVFKTIIVISTVVVALVVPLFGYLMSLVGAFLNTSLSMIIPCVCFMKIIGNFQILGFEVIVMYFIVIMGAGIMIVGTYTAVLELIHHL